MATSSTTNNLPSSSSSASLLPPSLSQTDLPLPRLVVFDLDYTLWPFWVDTHVTPPLKPNAARTSASDRYGEDFSFYVDVPEVLFALPRAGVRIGVASRTTTPALAKDLLKMLHVQPPHGVETPEGKPEKTRRAADVFDAGIEAYPGSKLKHMEALSKRTGVPYSEILFFDDESRNKETESLGVTMYWVKDGVSWGEIEKGVREWRRRRGHIASNGTDGSS